MCPSSNVSIKYEGKQNLLKVFACHFYCTSDEHTNLLQLHDDNKYTVQFHRGIVQFTEFNKFSLVQNTCVLYEAHDGKISHISHCSTNIQIHAYCILNILLYPNWECPELARYDTYSRLSSIYTHTVLQVWQIALACINFECIQPSVSLVYNRKWPRLFHWWSLSDSGVASGGEKMSKYPNPIFFEVQKFCKFVEHFRKYVTNFTN